MGVPALLLLALIVVPIVELYVIVQVGQGIGILPTLALLVVMSLLGGYLLRREGTRTWRALGDALQAGRLPAREVADGALVILGGALLLTPGFATDLFGLLCILPPTRAVLDALPLHQVASQGYCFQVDLAWQAWRGGYEVVEVPITFVERERGESKMSRSIVAEALWRVTWWGLRSARSRRTLPAHAERG